MEADVLSLEGKAVRQIHLPLQFQFEIREDLIQRAFLSERSFRYQPKGNFLLAGLQTTAEYYGRRNAWRQTINTGRSRLPREKIPKGLSGRVLRVPQAVKGRRAHPPKPLKKIRERINLKEKKLAILSAISASINERLVKEKHLINGVKLPLVLEDSLEEIKKTKELQRILQRLFPEELKRAGRSRKKREGRKGGYRTAKSALIVYANDRGISKAARNIVGVDTIPVEKLTAEVLAPGGKGGRLIIWTESSIRKLEQASFT